MNNPLLARPKRPLPARVGVVGAGTIGPDIGYYLKSELPDLHLVLIDVRQEALDAAVKRIHGYVEKGIQRGKLDPAKADRIRANIVATRDYGALASCDWVMEAATENLPLKQKIFSQIESLVGPDALITSNTSSLPGSRLFSHLEHPGRTAITHFFAPAWRSPAVEVIPWQKTDPELAHWLQWLFCLTGKVPMLTQDVVCFMLDRIFDNWCNEAGFLLDVATPAQIDTVAQRYVAAGPFFVLNFANGNPIIVSTSHLQADEEGEHYRPAPAFSNAGRWDTVKPGESVDVPEDLARTISDRLLGILFSQTVDILDRGIGTAADLDLGCRISLGFKKGPLELMRELGEAETRRILDAFHAWKPGMPMPQKPLAEYQKFRRFILVDEVDGVKVITLRRPEALNAVHDDMTDEILEVIRESENDPATAGFVITGFGARAFSAGADIGRFPSMLGNREGMIEYAKYCSRLLVHMDRCKKPIVAALNGFTLGGGLELVMRCHGIVATKSAWMQLPEITLGIVPGIGAMVVPYRRWPKASAVFHGMMTRAEKLTAAQAAEFGMVDALVDDIMDLLPAAIRRVRELSGTEHRIPDGPVEIAPIEVKEPRTADGRLLSAEVLGIMRRAIEEAAAAATFEEALEIGYRATGDSACTAAAREGITAFREKRPPDFSRTG
jgi:enoyl-CoA hydratase/3-hydroxyacyl-CoA dehydrogenase